MLIEVQIEIYIEIHINRHGYKDRYLLHSVDDKLSKTN